MVILQEQMQDDKVTKFINDNHTDILKTDPTQKMHRQIQNTLKLCNNIINQQKRKYIRQMNPKTPALKAKIRMHKASRPIRPVINNISAPSYKLAKPQTQRTHNTKTRIQRHKLYTVCRINS
jgi:thermostable 8-oxoguanine DNA glycosylase